MKKLLFIFTLTLSTIAYSQGIKMGLKAGVNFSNYSNSNIQTDAITSFHGGLVSEIKILKNFAFQPELLYSTQGATVNNLGQELKNELGYISIPVLAKFYLNDHLSFELGPQASFLLNERNNFSPSDSNSFDFAIASGLSYKFGKHFFIQGRYGLGLTEPKRDADIKNSVLQASIGYLF
jgi:hypothetical protein